MAAQDVDIQSFQIPMTTLLSNPTVEHSSRRRKLWRVIYTIHKAGQIFLSTRTSNANSCVRERTVLAYSACLNTADSETEPARSLELSDQKAPQVLQEERETSHLDIVVVEDPSDTTAINIVTSTSTSNDATLQRDKISEIVRARDLDTLRKFGGVSGIAEALNTDVSTGIPGDEDDLLCRRSPLAKAAAGTTEAPSPGFFGLLFRRCNDLTVILLAVAAVLYIVFGIKKAGTKTGWLPGTIIVLAAVILVLAPTLHDLWLRRLAWKRRLELDERETVDVFRGGLREKVFVSDIVPGDVVWLHKEGCSLVPADGLFIGGDFLVVSDGVEASADEESPFLFYGSTVSHGSGRMLVTTVGSCTELGEGMSGLVDGDCRGKGAARLVSQLDKLRNVMQIACLAISILMIALFLFLMIGRRSRPRAAAAKPSLPEVKSRPLETHRIVEMIERILMNPAEEFSTVKPPLAVLVLGVLEGMPFAIALSAIFWMKRILAGKARPAGLLDCVKMGSATAIVADKTVLSTTDVAECFVGGVVDVEAGQMPEAVREALCAGISAPVVKPARSGRRESVAEDPLVNWAGSKLGTSPDALRRNRTVLKTKRLSFDEEGSRVLMLKRREETVVLHCKGPAATVLRQSSSYYDTNGQINNLNEAKRQEFLTKIVQLEKDGLKAVAFSCKQIAEAPSPVLEEDGLILIAILGLRSYSCRCAETRDALRAFREAGARIVIVSDDDDAAELKKVAEECEILPPDGVAMSGDDFRSLDGVDIREKTSKVSVIDEASPSDRLLLIRRLKEADNVVAMLGTRTSDVLALKEADIGVAMGDWSSAAAMESSTVIALDASLSSVAAVMLCGRCTYSNIQKYVQLEIVTNIAGTLVASITTLWHGSSPVTGVHLIWTTFLVTVLAGPALLLEPPPDLRRGLPARSEPLVSAPMWRNIVVQSAYQTAILISLHLKSAELEPVIGKFGKPMVFNVLVLCQVFNLVSSREIQKKNFLAGIHRNLWIPAAMATIVAIQAGFIEVAHAVVHDPRLDLKQWCVCLLIGFCSWPLDFAAKCAWDFFVKIRKPANATMVHSDSAEYINNLELPLMSTSSSSSVAS